MTRGEAWVQQASMNLKSPSIQQRNLFQHYFKKNVMVYCRPFIGFDIFRFDEDIKTPDGVSTRDFIKKVWGAGAAKLVEELLKL